MEWSPGHREKARRAVLEAQRETDRVREQHQRRIEELLRGQGRSHANVSRYTPLAPQKKRNWLELPVPPAVRVVAYLFLIALLYWSVSEFMNVREQEPLVFDLLNRALQRTRELVEKLKAASLSK
jgi:hypothetical protein